MKQKEQKLEELMTGKHVKFKAKISEMDDEFIYVGRMNKQLCGRLLVLLTVNFSKEVLLIEI